MKYVVDLTKDNFDRIDFTEAKIVDFYCKRELPRNFDFTVWGATILLDPRWKHDKSFIPNHDSRDLYVFGIGTIEITDLLGGSIEVFIYNNVKDEQNRTIVAQNSDGSELVLRKQWGNVNEYKLAEKYLWECVMTWPYGFCNLMLYTNGCVAFDFNTEDLIPVEDYLKNPHRYGFKEV